MGKTLKKNQSAQLEWKPRLKNASRRSPRASASSHSMAAASNALSAIRTIDTARGDSVAVDQQLVATLARRCNAMETAAVGRQGGVPRRKETSTPNVGRRVLIGAAAAAMLLGVTLFCGGSLLPVERHTISGRVWLERHPLGMAELRFHSSGSDAASTKITVAKEDGGFRLDDVPTGTYRVTVHPAPTEFAPITKVASNYGDTKTTPFELRINRDVESVQLYAHAVMPKPRKITWKPGVD